MQGWIPASRIHPKYGGWIIAWIFFGLVSGVLVGLLKNDKMDKKSVTNEQFEKRLYEARS